MRTPRRLGPVLHRLGGRVLGCRSILMLAVAILTPAGGAAHTQPDEVRVLVADDGDQLIVALAGRSTGDSIRMLSGIDNDGDYLLDPVRTALLLPMLGRTPLGQVAITLAGRSDVWEVVAARIEPVDNAWSLSLGLSAPLPSAEACESLHVSNGGVPVMIVEWEFSPPAIGGGAPARGRRELDPGESLDLCIGGTAPD